MISTFVISKDYQIYSHKNNGKDMNTKSSRADARATLLVPWKEQSVGFRFSSDMHIAFNVLAYIRFMPLPASMNILPTSYPPICALSIIGE
jgi:hypothetical protein